MKSSKTNPLDGYNFIYKILIKFILIFLISFDTNVLNKCQHYNKENFLNLQSTSNNSINLNNASDSFYNLFEFFKFNSKNFLQLTEKLFYSNLKCTKIWPQVVANAQEVTNLSPLRTFLAYACQNDLLKLNCPKNSFISIYTAHYGSLKGASEPSKLCPDLHLKQNLIEQSSLENNEMNLDNNTCTSVHAYKVVDSKCSNRRKCTILANANSFVVSDLSLIEQEAKLMDQSTQLLLNLCKSVVTYAEVTYKCKPNSKSSKTICEDEKMHLSCPKNRVIMIYKAYFGPINEPYIAECKPYEENKFKSSGELISNNKINTLNVYNSKSNENEEECPITNETEMLIKLCQGSQKCNLIANDQTFNQADNQTNKFNSNLLLNKNTCKSKIKKRLKVLYTCAMPQILATSQHLDTITSKPLFRQENNLNQKASSSIGDENLSYDTSSETSIEDTIFSPNGKINHFNLTGTPKILENKEISKFNLNLDENCNQTDYNIKKSSLGFISEWIQAVYYMSGNIERLLLYFLVSILFAILCILLVMSCKLQNDKKRVKRCYKQQQTPVFDYVHNEEEDHLVSTSNSPEHYQLIKTHSPQLINTVLYSDNAENSESIFNQNQADHQLLIQQQAFQLQASQHLSNLFQNNLVKHSEQFSNEQLLINNKTSRFELKEDDEIDDNDNDDEEEDEEPLEGRFLENSETIQNTIDYNSLNLSSPKLLSATTNYSPKINLQNNIKLQTTKTDIKYSTLNPPVPIQPFANNLFLVNHNINQPVLNNSIPNLNSSKASYTSNNSSKNSDTWNNNFLTTPFQKPLNLLPNSTPPFNKSLYDNKNNNNLQNYQYNTIPNTILPYSFKQEVPPSPNSVFYTKSNSPLSGASPAHHFQSKLDEKPESAKTNLILKNNSNVCIKDLPIQPNSFTSLNLTDIQAKKNFTHSLNRSPKTNLKIN